MDMVSAKEINAKALGTPAPALASCTTPAHPLAAQPLPHKQQCRSAERCTITKSK